MNNWGDRHSPLDFDRNGVVDKADVRIFLDQIYKRESDPMFNPLCNLHMGSDINDSDIGLFSAMLKIYGFENDVPSQLIDLQIQGKTYRVDISKSVGEIYEGTQIIGSFLNVILDPPKGSVSHIVYSYLAGSQGAQQPEHSYIFLDQSHDVKFKGSYTALDGSFFPNSGIPQVVDALASWIGLGAGGSGLRDLQKLPCSRCRGDRGFRFHLSILFLTLFCRSLRKNPALDYLSVLMP